MSESEKKRKKEKHCWFLLDPMFFFLCPCTDGILLFLCFALSSLSLCCRLLSIAEETLAEFLSKATGTAVEWVQMPGMKVTALFFSFPIKQLMPFPFTEKKVHPP